MLLEFLKVFNILFSVFLFLEFGAFDISSKSVKDLSYSIMVKISISTRLFILSISKI